MQRILIGLLMMFVGSLFASDEAYIANIEAEALAHARHFSDDIKHQLNEQKSAPQFSQMPTYAKNIVHAMPQEPLSAHLDKVSHTLVFLSFSMPETSLLQWLIQCKQAGATPVIRGLIHNSFKDTMSVIAVLSKKTGIGVQLDPILFQTFAINAVPAVVFIRETPSCPTNSDCLPPRFDSLFGDVSLDYALQKFNEGEPHPNLTRMIQQFQTVRSG